MADRDVTRAQLHHILDGADRDHITVRVGPFETDYFAGASAAMLRVGGPHPRLDTVLRDSPSGTAFLAAESQLDRFRALFREVREAVLDPAQSRDFIHRLAKEV